MRSIVAGCITFNSADVIEASLNSVIDWVDHVIVVDGAFLGLPDPHDYSYDGTIEIARRIAGRKGTIITPPFRLTQPKKQNLILEVAKSKFPNSWVFIFEHDEVLHDSQNEFQYLRSSEADVYRIATIRRNDTLYNRMYTTHLYGGIRDVTSYHPRFYGRIPGLHYAEHHFAVRDGAGVLVKTKYPSFQLRDAWLEHRRNERNVRYIEDSAYYNIYERWKYEHTLRPLMSRVPYSLIRASKHILRKGEINGEFVVNWIHAHTLGWKSRDR